MIDPQSVAFQIIIAMVTAGIPEGVETIKNPQSMKKTLDILTSADTAIQEGMAILKTNIAMQNVPTANSKS